MNPEIAAMEEIREVIKGCAWRLEPVQTKHGIAVQVFVRRGDDYEEVGPPILPTNGETPRSTFLLLAHLVATPGLEAT